MTTAHPSHNAEASPPPSAAPPPITPPELVDALFDQELAHADRVRLADLARRDVPLAREIEDTSRLIAALRAPVAAPDVTSRVMESLAREDRLRVSYMLASERPPRRRAKHGPTWWGVSIAAVLALGVFSLIYRVGVVNPAGTGRNTATNAGAAAEAPDARTGRAIADASTTTARASGPTSGPASTGSSIGALAGASAGAAGANFDPASAAVPTAGYGLDTRLDGSLSGVFAEADAAARSFAQAMRAGEAADPSQLAATPVAGVGGDPFAKPGGPAWLEWSSGSAWPSATLALRWPAPEDARSFAAAGGAVGGAAGGAGRDSAAWGVSSLHDPLFGHAITLRRAGEIGVVGPGAAGGDGPMLGRASSLWMDVPPVTSVLRREDRWLFEPARSDR